MIRTVAAVALACALTLPVGTAHAADWPTAEDCTLYDAAFKAVIGDETPSTKPRRVAFTTVEKPLGLEPGETSVGSPLNLKACIALTQRVYAAGMTFEGRPAFGFRMPGTPYYEHFSRWVNQGGKMRVTYWTSPLAGVNLTLSRTPDGGWSVDAAEDWVTVAENRQ